jgi:hypothetical protein
MCWPLLLNSLLCRQVLLTAACTFDIKHTASGAAAAEAHSMLPLLVSSPAHWKAYGSDSTPAPMAELHNVNTDETDEAPSVPNTTRTCDLQTQDNQDNAPVACATAKWPN